MATTTLDRPKWGANPEMARAVRLLALRKMIQGHPLDAPKMPERRQRATGKRSNAPLLWIRGDGSRGAVS